MWFILRPYSKMVCLFLFQEARSLKKGILFLGIYFGFLRHESKNSLHVGKQEISFPISVFKGSVKIIFRKLILAFQHCQTLLTTHFFEWIPGLEVSGEEKMGCVRCPI